MLDLVIRNAQVFDGTGATPFHADVGVSDGRIAEVGKNLGAAVEVLDAQGLALAPGIIDTHTHYDAQITWDPFLSPSPSLGVTTALMGNCGFTIAPCRPEDRELTMRNLTHVEGMSLDALRNGIDWGFETFPQYLDQLESRGVGLNVACFVGHSSVRTYVLRDQATLRSAKAEEVARMRALVVDAMRAGALGFSTTRSGQHNGEAGIPMPSRLADEEELLSLSAALKDVGRGVLMMTRDVIGTSIESIERLAQAAQRPYVVAALLHSTANPNGTFEDLARIAQAQQRGNRLWGAISVCPLNFEFSMHEPYVFEGLDAWQPIMKASHEQARILYAGAKLRQDVKAELAQPKRRLFDGHWHLMQVAQVKHERNRAMEGKTVADLGRAAGKHPFDFLLDLALEEDLDTVFTATLLNSDEDAVGRMMLDRHSLISLSDAGAHLTFLCDAGFGLHLYGYWVRQRGIMTLQEAVRKVTSQPAQLFGLQNRGGIAPGMHADLMLFDPATVGRGPSRRVHDLPAGASRLTTPSTGLHGVWVNGRKVADGAGMVAEAPRAGQVLRSFDA